MLVYFSGHGQWSGTSKPAHETGIFVLPDKNALDIQYKKETITKVLYPYYGRDGVSLKGSTSKDKVYFELLDNRLPLLKAIYEFNGERFTVDDVVTEQPASAIKEKVQKQRSDDVDRAMDFYIQQYEQKHKKTPACKPLWELMADANLEHYGLSFNSKKTAIIKDSGSEVDLEAFKDRYGRLYPKK